MAEARTLVGVDRSIIERIDRLADREHRTREELVQEALDSYLDRKPRSDPSDVDRAIVESYSRQPQEVVGGEWAARQAILADPWPKPER